jgi:dCMP deaminase
MNHWDKRFLELAQLVAGWSKDPSTKCGAVIVDPSRRVVSLGFNGFPVGVPDLPEHYEDRSEKYPRVIHAEKNAILFAQRDLSGCTIYVWPMMPCPQCAAYIIQADIKRVVTVGCDSDQAQRWGEAFRVSTDMFERAGVTLEVYDK